MNKIPILLLNTILNRFITFSLFLLERLAEIPTVTSSCEGNFKFLFVHNPIGSSCLCLRCTRTMILENNDGATRVEKSNFFLFILQAEFFHFLKSRYLWTSYTNIYIFVVSLFQKHGIVTLNYIQQAKKAGCKFGIGNVSRMAFDSLSASKLWVK